MTTIKILIYTDKKEISRVGTVLDWKLSILPNTLEAVESPFVNFKVDVINRNRTFNVVPPNEQDVIRLTTELLQEFDEVWFMGTYQQNVDTFSEGFGGPKNELNEDEVNALASWMNNEFGGVLITGDHATDRPGQVNDPKDEQLALGRALGQKVPRAGQLRIWKGPPTLAPADAFNTLSTGVVDPTQDDPIPQRLLFDHVDARGVPHELFWGKDQKGKQQFINVFPDHAHEGGLIIPEPDNTWPPFDAPPGTVKPKAVSIASGINFAPNGGRNSVLVTYDGDSVGVGRIVADSSFHHYLDVNLEGFNQSEDKSILRSITQFYRNLAFYLIPLSKRQQIAKEMFARIVTHPAVLEERGNRAEAIGNMAQNYLSRVASPIELNEMVHMLLPPVVRADTDNAFLPVAFGDSSLPSQEMVLGSMIARELQSMARVERVEAGVAPDADEGIDSFTAGLQDALQSHTDRMKEFAANNEKVLALLE